MYVRVCEFFVFCWCYARTILPWATAMGNCSATAGRQATAAMPTNRGASAWQVTAAMPTNRGASALGDDQRQPSTEQKWFGERPLGVAHPQ